MPPNAFNVALIWVDAHAGAIQAISTVVLAALTGYYVVLLRRQLVQARKLVDQQRNDFDAREQEGSLRAVESILLELEFNNASGSAPFLDGAYQHCVWAVKRIPLHKECIRQVGAAYAAIKKANIAYDFGVAGLDEKRASLHAAKDSISAAIEGLKTELEMQKKQSVLKD